MFKNRNKPEFAVIGLGRFGRAVVKTLVAKGFHVLGVDREQKAVQAVLDTCTQAVVLDSTNEDALRELGIDAFDTVVVAIGADFESNLITTAALKAIGVEHVICKALSTRQKDILGGITTGAFTVLVLALWAYVRGRKPPCFWAKYRRVYRTARISCADDINYGDFGIDLGVVDYTPTCCARQGVI